MRQHELHFNMLIAVLNIILFCIYLFSCNSRSLLDSVLVGLNPRSDIKLTQYIWCEKLGPNTDWRIVMANYVVYEVWWGKLDKCDLFIFFDWFWLIDWLIVAIFN